jgi:hypothetical protein
MISNIDPQPGAEDADKPGRQAVSTSGAEERGERIETGRQIARGGKDQGCVPGATGDDLNDPRSGQDGCDRP